MTGRSGVRRAEDIGGQELSYAEVKAIVSGNPAVLTLAETDAELQRLSILKRNHSDEQFLARHHIRDLPGQLERLQKRLTALTADQDTATAHADDPLTIGNRSYDQEDVINVLGKALHFIPEQARETRRVPIGVYCGWRFGLVLHPQFPPELYLEGTLTRQSVLSREERVARQQRPANERG